VWESLPDAQAQLLARDIEGFQAEFPQYRLTLQHYDSPENFMTPLAANQIEFDVILASPVLLGALWSAEQVAPMADFFPRSFIDGFAAVPLLGGSRDAIIWGLPDTAGFHLLLFYNRNLVDTPPSNTTDLFELAEDLTQSSQWGLGVNSYDPLWLTPWLVPYGGWLTDKTGQPTLDTPAMEAAITLHLSWQSRLTGIAPVETYDEIRTKFLDGNMAMMIDGEWTIGELAGANKIDWAVAALPNAGPATESQPAAPLVLARYWAISRTATGNRALAAATFLEFIQLTRLTQFGLLPTQREALDDPRIVNDPVWRVSAAQMQAGRTVPLGVNANSLMDAMRRPLQGVVDGELTPGEAAEMMQHNVKR
jgi:maltose-binding protein MalE